LAALCGRGAFWRLVTCIAASSVAISAAVWVGTDLRFYRGLSGIDSALFVMLAVQILSERVVKRQRFWTWMTVALLLGFILKLGFEAATGSAVFVDSHASGMTPVPLAHLVGAAVGLVVGLTPRECHAGRATPMMSGWRFRFDPAGDDTGSISVS
jgi:hypothetical protein